MALRRKKDEGHVLEWIAEPDQGMHVGSTTDQLGGVSFNSGISNQTPFALQSHDSANFRQQQIPIHKKVAFNGPSQWPEGGGQVPMGIKRKGDKKEKKSKKKDKKKDMNLHISGPIGNVLHVGMQGTALPTEHGSSSNSVQLGLGPGEHTMGQNWILGPKQPTSFPTTPDSLPPRPTQAPPPPPPAQSPSQSVPLQSMFTPSPSRPPGGQPNNAATPGLGHPATPTSSPHAVPNQAEYARDDRSPQGEGRSASKSSIGGKAGVEAEIKRTMKASKIQRDVDILNHVLDDLESFMSTLKDKAAAWAELERKSKKSRRKKNDGALEILRKRAEPPTEQEFIVTYQKCKYGINLISKLGHHLSSPTPTQLLKGFYVYIQEMVNMNKGKQLAASIVSPLFTRAACDLMKRKLEPKDKELWGELGGNWLITIDQWPQQSPLPEYEIEFTDGCVPPNLHNSSDCPSNFPTLDTLPRGKRTKDYSEAYDGDQAESTGGLMISPAIMSLMGATKQQRKSSITVDSGQLLDTRSQQSLHSSSSLENEPKKAKIIFDYEASALGELSVRRGETVEVIEEVSPSRWQVRNKFGGTGQIPIQNAEVLQKKKSKGDSKPLDDANMIHLHGKNVPAPPKITPPPVPGYGNRSPQLGGSHSGRNKVSQQPQNLFTVPEDSESRASTISRPAPHPPLGSPPPFSPVSPQPSMGFPNMPPPPPMGVPGPPSFPGSPPPPPPPPGGAGGGGPPLPPPPPPVAAPKQPFTLQEMIQQNKEKLGQDPQRKASSVQKPEFDIAEAMAKRKPLRKTSTALVMHTEEVDSDHDISNELKEKLLIRKNSAGQIHDDGYRVLPWKATISEIKKWLIAQGYGSCAEKVTCKKGEELYAKSRDELKVMLGNSGVRLYSQLQADRSRAQKEGGAEKVSEFQKLMQARKTATEETGLVRAWGGNRPAQQENTADNEEQVPAWKQKLRTKLAEKETFFDDTIPRGGSRGQRRDVVQRGGGGGGGGGREWGDSRSRREGRYSRGFSDEEGQRGRQGEDRGGGRRTGKYSEQRGRRDSYYSDDDKRNRRISRDHRRGRRDSHYSDDDKRSRRISKDHRRGRKDSENQDDDRRGRKGRHRRDKRRDDSFSDDCDYDSGYERRKDKKKKNKKGEKDGKRRRPTNIDDYDEQDYYSENSSSSSRWSGSSSDSDSSDDEERRAAETTMWALAGVDPADAEKMSERIKSQQAKIKKELASLSELQKETGNKTLSPDLQKMLQQDLQKLEQLQTMLRQNQGNQSLQMQLLGQQVLLSEHLAEAKESITPKEEDKKKEEVERVSPPVLPGGINGHVMNTPTPTNYRLHMLQQQALASEHQMQAMAAKQQMQQVLATEHQMQAIAAEQHMQAMAAEQQRQMLMAADQQQRQMQMAQMASMQSPYMSPQQTAFGMSPMTPMYSPYPNTVGYF